MRFSEECKQKKIKIELTTHDGGRCWKKFADKKTYYFNFPDTKEGYSQALEQWYLVKAQVASERPHAEVFRHHIDLFNKCLSYYENFGTVPSETKLHAEIKAFVDYVKDLLSQPKLTMIVPLNGFERKHEFFEEFFTGNTGAIGTDEYRLPNKWQDRISRMTPIGTEKKPQTIGYWLDAYKERLAERAKNNFIVEESATGRGYKLAHFKKYADLQAHVSTITNEYLTKYHTEIQSTELARESKQGYWDAFKMMVRWASSETSCDLEKPSKLDSKSEWKFTDPVGTGRKRMAKKKLLWTPDEFQLALVLPSPYNGPDIAFATLVDNLIFCYLPENLFPRVVSFYYRTAKQRAM